MTLKNLVARRIAELELILAQPDQYATHNREVTRAEYLQFTQEALDFNKNFLVDIDHRASKLLSLFA